MPTVGSCWSSWEQQVGSAKEVVGAAGHHGMVVVMETTGRKCQQVGSTNSRELLVVMGPTGRKCKQWGSWDQQVGSANSG